MPEGSWRLAPSDLTFLWRVNLKTAKALGLAIPGPLLFRADEVIKCSLGTVVEERRIRRPGGLS